MPLEPLLSMLRIAATAWRRGSCSQGSTAMAPKTRRKLSSSAASGAEEDMSGRGGKPASKGRGKGARAPVACASGAAGMVPPVAGGAAAKPPEQPQQKTAQHQRQSQRSRVSKEKEEHQEEEEEEEGTAGTASMGGGEQQRGKRQKREVVVPEPSARCFSTVQTNVRVGTSGYSYPHWRGSQGYYGGLPQRLEWELFSQEFDMLEINSTFYGWHKEPVWDAWKERASVVRPSFEYVVKAQQFYTHRKRLNVDDAFTDSWTRFWACCQRLRPHLGPVLFQFPAKFRTTSGKGEHITSNIDRLRRLGEVLPAGEKFVFEFRDASWLCREVYDVLSQHDWCLAITHCTDAPHGRKLEKGGWIGSLTPGPNPRPEEYPLDCCSWGVYVRFHGSEGQYRGTHGAAEMQQWASHAKRWAATGRRVYFAFNNDTVPVGESLPSAIADCRSLAAALRGCGVWPVD